MFEKVPAYKSSDGRHLSYSEALIELRQVMLIEKYSDPAISHFVAFNGDEILRILQQSIKELDKVT